MNRNNKNDFSAYYKGNIQIDALNLLKNELNQLQSIGYTIKYAVLFGDKTQALSTLFPSSCTIINFPHPAHSANRKWAGIVNPLPCNDINKVNHIKNELKNKGI